MNEQAAQQSERRAEPKPGDIIANKYHVEVLIGSGSMGSVYAARNLRTGKRVALKWLLSERASDAVNIARFHREARMAGRIDHPNVVTIYDVGRHESSTFLVMELLSGESLREVMRRGPIPTVAAVQLLMPALRGIAAAHAEGVIHRDLKPDNIFLCRSADGTPREAKVLDFGISKLADEVREGLSVTQTGTVIGTPYYLSPEQIRGVKDIDLRIDVYAVGVILYEMLAGRPPFVTETYTSLVVEIATGHPPPLQELRSGVSAELAGVVARAMHRDRTKRYEDVETLALALEPFGAGSRFRPDRPDWTGPNPVVPLDAAPLNSTMADTEAQVVAVDTLKDEHAPETEELDEAPGQAAVAVEERSGAWHEGAPPPDELRARRVVWPLWVGGAVVLLLLVLWAAMSDSDAEDPVGSPSGMPSVGADPPLEDTEPAPTARSETSERSESTEPPEPREPVRALPMEQPPVQAAGRPTRPAPNVDRTGRERAASSATRTKMHAGSPLDATRAMPGMTRATPMRRHRAGQITLDDF